VAVLFKSRYVVKPAVLSGLVAYAGIKSSSFFYTHIVSKLFSNMLFA
jgi:hypothetical protein